MLGESARHEEKGNGMEGKPFKNPRDLCRPGKIPGAILRGAPPPIPDHFQLVILILPVVVGGFGPHPEDGFVIPSMNQGLYCAQVKFDGLMPRLWASQPMVA